MMAHVPPGRGRGLPGLIIDLLYLLKLDRDAAERLKAQEDSAGVTTAEHYLDRYDADVLDEADFVFEERHGPYGKFERRYSTGKAEDAYRKICDALQHEKRSFGHIVTRGMTGSRYRGPVVSSDDVQASERRGPSVWRRIGCAGVVVFPAALAMIALGVWVALDPSVPDMNRVGGLLCGGAGVCALAGALVRLAKGGSLEL